MKGRIISSIIFDERLNYPYVIATSEERNNSNLGNAHGWLTYSVRYNNQESYDLFLDILRNDTIGVFLNIDARFLTDEIIDILNKSKFLHTIRITNSGYKVNNDLCSKLDSRIFIIADEQEENLMPEYQNRITLQHGNYKLTMGYQDNDTVFSYFLDHNPSDNELDALIRDANQLSRTNKVEINYRHYEPKEYKELLKRFQKRGLRKDATVSFLGNPLRDDTTSFKDIDKVSSNPIKIVYDTCHDIIGVYENEPFETNNSHHSELEGGGITSPQSYQQLLEILDEQEKHIKDMGYSPLEATIYVYRYLQKHYAYDPEYQTTDAMNVLTNRQLDIVAGNQTLVCEGYATLFSALLRRCNIPTFRYSTHRHCRNVGRIKDTKYNVDKIAVFDPTFDCSTIDENGYFMESDKFKYFMLSPEEIAAYDQYITIPTSLVIDYARTSNGTENDTLSILSRDLYEADLSLDYTADGYAITMLKLMGLNPKYNDFREYREFLRELNNTSIFDEIDPKVVSEAYKNVLRKEEKDLGERGIKALGKTVEYDMATRRLETERMAKTIELNYSCTNCIKMEDVFYPHNHTKQIKDFELQQTTEEEKQQTTEQKEQTTNQEEQQTEQEEKTTEQENQETKEEKPEEQETEKSDTTYSLKKDEIIQDLPIYSKEESRFKGRMTDEEIRESQIKLGFIKPDMEDKPYKVVREPQPYSLTKDEIIQDLPIYSKEESRFKGRMTDEEIEAAKVKIKR